MKHGVFTPWVKKQDTKHLSISWPNIDRFSNFFHCYTRQKISNKAYSLTTPQRRRYITLWNISSQKLHRLEAQQQQTKCARTVKECHRDRWAASKQLWLDKNSSFRTSNRTVWGRTDHLLYGDLGLKCSKRRLLNNWLKQTAMQYSAAQNSCWMMLSSFRLLAHTKLCKLGVC